MEVTDLIDKDVVFRIKDYLKSNGIVDIDNEKSKMQLRAEGKEFSTEDHIQGIREFEIISANRNLL